MREQDEVTAKDFSAYVCVQRSGRWNMYDPRAREATGLSREKYLYIIKHYSELAEKFKIGLGKEKKNA